MLQETAFTVRCTALGRVTGPGARSSSSLRSASSSSSAVLARVAEAAGLAHLAHDLEEDSLPLVGEDESADSSRPLEHVKRRRAPRLRERGWPEGEGDVLRGGGRLRMRIVISYLEKAETGKR